MKKKDADKLIEVLRFYYWEVKAGWIEGKAKQEELDHINELCVIVDEELR